MKFWSLLSNINILNYFSQVKLNTAQFLRQKELILKEKFISQFHEFVTIIIDPSTKQQNLSGFKHQVVKFGLLKDKKIVLRILNELQFVSFDKVLKAFKDNKV